MIRQIVLAGFTLIVTSGSVYGAHPLVTDDTGTQGSGKSQIEVNGEYAVDKSSIGGVVTKEKAGEVGFIVSHGVSDSTDVVLGIPYQRFQVKENGVTSDREDGLSDVAVEVKHRFYDKDGLSLAVKPGLSLPTGDEEMGLGAGKPGYGVTLIATKEAGLGKFHFNAGINHSEYKLQADKDTNRNDVWHLSLAGEYAAMESLTFVANIGVERNGDKTSNSYPAFALAGLIYSATDHLDINGGVKFGLSDAETDAAFLTGIAARF